MMVSEFKKKADLELLRLSSKFSSASRLKVRHFNATGRIPNIKRPTSFNEKILHRRLYAHDSRIPPLIDKASAKEFVENHLGKEWITPSLFVGENLPEKNLRNWRAPYVIKATHGTYMNIFVREGQNINWDEIENKIKGWQQENYGWWPYFDIRKWILVEPFIGTGSAPTDYKFFVFDGKVKFLQVDLDRHENHTQTFFDTSFRQLPFQMAYPTSDNVSKPESFGEMLSAASILGKGFDFVRVDFYEIDKKPRFGELTFFPYSGLQKFIPDSWDYEIGKLWTIADPAINMETT